jgi:4,5-DOPA dioxygenase extradiol
VAQMVAVMLERAGIEARLDPERGLDHGVWVPLSLAFPEAAVPVIQVALPLASTPQRILAIGRALAPLRHEHILFVGTGGIVHNLARAQMDTDSDSPSRNLR